MFADKHVAKNRYLICRNCPELRPLVKLCSICNCFMPAKVRIANAECPQQRWLAVNELENDEYWLEEDES